MNDMQKQRIRVMQKQSQAWAKLRDYIDDLERIGDHGVRKDNDADFQFDLWLCQQAACACFCELATRELLSTV